MKKLSILFAVLAVLLSNMMCVAVTFNCTALRYAPGNSAPWTVGLLYIIPFAIGILACALVSFVTGKKAK